MRVQVATGLRLLCYSVLAGAIVASALLCSRAPDKDKDQVARLERRRDLQEVYYEVAMAFADAGKGTSVEQVLQQLRKEKGDAFFRCQPSQSPIYVNLETEKWADWRKNPEDVATYVRYQTPDGTPRILCKLFNDELRELPGQEPTGGGQFWSCERGSATTAKSKD